MRRPQNQSLHNRVAVLWVVILLVLGLVPAWASGYAEALKGIKAFNAVYQFTSGDPGVANRVFWAVKNSYEDQTVRDLGLVPRIVVVFHGPVVHLISTNLARFPDEVRTEVEQFQTTIRQMKQDGVKFEVCLYAVKMAGVDPASILPEVDSVANGFVSVIGYQMQGYAVVRIP
ncbi:DsrE family protein [Pelovirga terrestris]|uniref:DsrE family protein n=1 Tax=Pelovirga terrestris TaxID=2771352 RepID=A0A8J6QPY9_9BACT|nr:DsrE family protein [Pelovirga terrestris]MBD1399745.1 DsrE family protein [Pelovirga terrestris]